MKRPPVPWKPVTVSEGPEISVLGRAHHFGAGPLPAQISSAGAPLLAAPMRLELDSGQAALDWQAPLLDKHEAVEAALACRGSSPGLRWTARTVVTYDGLVWVTVKATPGPAGGAIKRLSLVVPMRDADARLYSHHFAINRAMSPAWRSFFQDAPENLWDAGALPTRGWSGRFTSQLWVGGYERGLAVYAETPENWSIEADAEVMLVGAARNGRREVRVDFVQEPLPLNGAWQIDFGLMATPVRPPETRPEAFRTMHTGGYDPKAGFDSAAGGGQGKPKGRPGDIRKALLERYARDGVRVVLLWNKWSDLLGFPLITDPLYRKYTRETVDYAHSLGLKVVPYCSTLGMFVSTHPEFEKLKDKFVVCSDYWRDPFSKEKESRIYRVAPTQEWTDWYAAQLAEFAKTYNVDGVYLDTIHKADVPMQGKRVFYGLRLWRRFYERVYSVFHGEVVENGFVYMHDSDPNIFMFSCFGDLRLTGEMQYYAAACREQVRAALPHLRDRMPLNKFFVWSSGAPLGGVAAKWCWKEPTKPYSVGARTIRESRTVSDVLNNTEALALAGLFDMHLCLAPKGRHNAEVVDATVAAWALEDRIKERNPLWFGWWDASRYLRADPGDDVATSGFLAPGRSLLAHVANLRAETRSVTVSLLAPTGLAESALTVDGQVCPDGCTVRAGAGELTVALAPNSYVRVMVRGAE